MSNTCRSAVLESLLGAEVIAYQHCGDADASELYDEEARIIGRAVRSRRADFIAGRLAARAALATLGVNKEPLLRNSDGAPVWPAGVVGSITHTNGFCGAAIAPMTAYRGLGIDAEGRWSVGEEVWDLVLTAAERNRIERLPAGRRREVAAILFCAKEAFYKCQYQITGAWLDYADAEVAVRGHSFFIRLLRDVESMQEGARFVGSHTSLPTIIVAAIGIPNIGQVFNDA